MSLEAYKAALKLGEKEYTTRLSKKLDPYLPILDDITENVKTVSRVKLGLVTIPMDQIAGTVNANRSNAFASNFMPLLQIGSEFASKWSVLHDSLEEDGLRDPVIAFEYMNKFYIREGNKRVSVSKYMGAVEIEGTVTRIVPAKDNSPEVSLYYEFLDFYEITGINYIYFSKSGSFKKFIKLIIGENGKWTEDDELDVRSLFTKFKKEYTLKYEDKLPLPVSDAFLVYVTLLGFDTIKNNSLSEVKDDISKIRSEIIRDAQPEPTAISTHPTAARKSVLSMPLTILKATKKLKIAFVHLGNMENSAWVYAHELGRRHLEDEAFPNEIITESFFDISMNKAEETLETLCHNDYDIIFVTSPQHNAACAKVAVLHPEVKILNCSLNVSTKHVRTYYLRTYESKYLLGLIAGAMTENNRIAYIADYPVYGSIASINAFAIGAKTVNPKAEIYLSWTSEKGSDPDKDIKNFDCDLVSDLDWSSPKHLTRKFGLYLYKDGTPLNLAAPLWNWGKLYESIVKSVKRGSWKIEEANNVTRSIGYWWGISSGAVDLVYSAKVPHLTMDLVNYLKNRIKASDFTPFANELTFQNGKTIDAGHGLNIQSLIDMDELVENVHGYIPGIHDVKDDTVSLAKVQGVAVSPEEI